MDDEETGHLQMISFYHTILPHELLTIITKTIGISTEATNPHDNPEPDASWRQRRSIRLVRHGLERSSGSRDIAINRKELGRGRLKIERTSRRRGFETSEMKRERT